MLPSPPAAGLNPGFIIFNIAIAGFLIGSGLYVRRMNASRVFSWSLIVWGAAVIGHVGVVTYLNSAYGGLDSEYLKLLFMTAWAVELIAFLLVNAAVKIVIIWKASRT